MVEGVRHIEVSFHVHGEAGGEIKASKGWATVEQTTDAAAGKGAHNSLWRYFAYTVVIGIRNKEVACHVDGNAPRARKARIATSSVGKALGAAGKRADFSFRCYFAYTVVAGIRNPEVACQVDGNAPRAIKLCKGCLTVDGACDAAAGKGADFSFRCYLAYTVVIGIRNKEVARRIYGDAPGVIKVKACTASLSVGKALGAAGKGADFSCGRYFLNEVSAGIHHIEVVLQIYRNIQRRVCRIEADKKLHMAFRAYFAYSIVVVICHKEFPLRTYCKAYRPGKGCFTPLAVGKVLFPAAGKGADKCRRHIGEGGGGEDSFIPCGYFYKAAAVHVFGDSNGYFSVRCGENFSINPIETDLVEGVEFLSINDKRGAMRCLKGAEAADNRLIIDAYAPVTHFGVLAGKTRSIRRTRPRLMAYGA